MNRRPDAALQSTYPAARYHGRLAEALGQAAEALACLGDILNDQRTSDAEAADARRAEVRLRAAYAAMTAAQRAVAGGPD